MACKETCNCCKKISIDELRKNDGTAGSIWVAIHGNVYDVSSFCKEHPGGEEVLREHGGRDATIEFDDVSHSSDAKELLKKYNIGKLVPKPAPPKN